jgi:hypothetical protein
MLWQQFWPLIAHFHKKSRQSNRMKGTNEIDIITQYTNNQFVNLLNIINIFTELCNLGFYFAILEVSYNFALP